MNKIIYHMVFSISFFSFISCSGPNPARQEMVGRWVGNSGTEVNINGDGTFRGKHFPFKKFIAFIKPQDSLQTEFDGEGRWDIAKNGSYWEVTLKFDKTSPPGYLLNYPLLVGGENGVLANKPPWYLYYWVEEEGGERYKFLKK